MTHFLQLNGARPKKVAAASSGGGGDANKIPTLNGSGELADDMLPTIPAGKLPAGVAADKKTVIVANGVTVTAGEFVNLLDNAGTLECRLADNSNNRPAHGYVKDTVVGDGILTVDVWFDRENANVSPTTVAAEQYLGTAGAITETVPSASGEIIQSLGFATSASTLEVEIGEVIEIE